MLEISLPPVVTLLHCCTVRDYHITFLTRNPFSLLDVWSCSLSNTQQTLRTVYSYDLFLAYLNHYFCVYWLTHFLRAHHEKFKDSFISHWSLLHNKRKSSNPSHCNPWRMNPWWISVTKVGHVLPFNLMTPHRTKNHIIYHGLLVFTCIVIQLSPILWLNSWLVANRNITGPQAALLCVNWLFPSYVSGVCYSYLIIYILFSCILFLPNHLLNLSRLFYIPILSSVITTASPGLVIHTIKQRMFALSCK